MHVRNIIIEKKHAKLKVVMTKRKTILSGKRKVINEKHILTRLKILISLIDAEKKTKKRKTIGAKKGKRAADEVEEESNDESEASQDELLVILDCIQVEY